MPLISKVAWIDYVFRIAPFTVDVPVFVPLAISSTKLSDNTVIVNDFCTTDQKLTPFSELWIPIKQVFQCYKDAILPPDEVVKVINGMCEAHVFFEHYSSMHSFPRKQ